MATSITNRFGEAAGGRQAAGTIDLGAERERRGRGAPAETTRQRGHYDYSLLFLTVFLVGFGLIMVFSTSYYNSTKYYNDPLLYVKRQALFAAVGVPIMILVSMIDYRIYMKPLPILRLRPVMLLYLVCLALQAAVPLIGKETNGSTRWLVIGPVQFQPSELTKICVLLVVAYLVQKAPRKLDRFRGFMVIVILMAPLLGLVVAENFSTALVLLAMLVMICFVASKKKLYFIVAGLLFVGIGLALIFGTEYRGERIDIWLNLETHPKGFQILQGLYAIASGSVFGRGLGNSMQKLGYIPEAHNDMIFSVICEELGIFGAIAVLMLFVLLIWRLFVIAINAADLFGGLIVTGILTHIAVQVLINVAVVTNSIPSTGIPLPFISYGGSSLLVLLAEMGIALSVSRHAVGDRDG